MMSEEKKRNKPEDLKSSMPKIKFLAISVLVPVLFSCLVSICVNHLDKYVQNCMSSAINNTKPIFWIYNEGKDESHLKHIIMILEKLGFRRGNNESDWDLLWSHSYPFRSLSNEIKNMKKHQRINHIPGNGYVVNKADLSTKGGPYIPASFAIPDDKDALMDFVKEYPKKMFVKKSNGHRGVKIKKIEDIDYTEDETFVQEFIEKPYLVDGYKFDVGVYTVITSIDPLRLYAYKGDMLFRFCPHKYYPFDPEDVDKYVIGDDYLPIWNVPSLTELYVDLGFSMKDTFSEYVRLQGQDPNKLWDTIYDAIKSLILSKEKLIANILKKYPTGRNFFELVRIDFALDEDLNVFIMEANMSPNLSSAHFPPNRLLYEQVLFNLFALIGVGQRFDSTFKRFSNWKDREVEVADKNLVALPEVCSSCYDCFRVECQLCLPCFTDEMRLILSQSYIEHQNKMDFKRIFPPTITEGMSFKDHSLRNQLLIRWYQGKCANDVSWCN